MIPKIIHQIWSDKQKPLPKACEELTQTWKNNHPEWDYRFWNEALLDAFIHDNFPEYEQRYRSLSHDIQRWDVIRYLILYQMGGVYVDIDYECLMPIDSLLANHTCCFAREAEAQFQGDTCGAYIQNAFMASELGHPFIKELIDCVFGEKYEIPGGMSGMNEVLFTTGPIMASRVYFNSTHKDLVYAIPASLITPYSPSEVIRLLEGEEDDALSAKADQAYGVHYFLGLWIDQEMLSVHKKPE